MAPVDVRLGGPGTAPVRGSSDGLPHRLTRRAWDLLRCAGLVGLLSVCTLLLIRPEAGLLAFWGVLVPALPLLFLLAPGIWRNICPLATANQLARRAGYGASRRAPAWLQRHGYLIATALFVGLVAARPLLLDHDAAALAWLLILLVVAAAVGGVLLQGKSGWCSSLCPLLPVQRLYGQTPFLVAANSHCAPCVGCTRNCYDADPRTAYQADLHDQDRQWRSSRELFAGAFPGVVVGYFTAPTDDLSQHPVRYLVLVLASAGSFAALRSVTRISGSRLATMYGAVAFVSFYGFSLRPVARLAEDQASVPADLTYPVVLAAVGALAASWLRRSARVERAYLRSSSLPSSAGGERAFLEAPAHIPGAPCVRIEPHGREVEGRPGQSLLEVLEGNGLPIEAGCRLGMCGADPVRVLDGARSLSEQSAAEAATLRRLGHGPSTRLACVARLQGSCTVALAPEPDRPGRNVIAGDPSIRDVVIIGTGVAGVSAAEAVRRRHATCAIQLVGREPHGLYNRMALSRVVHGRTAMQGLQLLPETWYDAKQITPWLNTEVRRIDLDQRVVELGTGELLRWDRLVLATGGRAARPPVEGFGGPGTFVLRQVDDAIRLRSWVQRVRARRAVVAGGGLLGLEAAAALLRLGLHVTVLERGPRLLARVVDERCSSLLCDHLTQQGAVVLTGVEAGAVQPRPGTEQLAGVVLRDGRQLPADLLLACTGVEPDVDLARSAGLLCRRGIVVDEQMRTSAPEVFAAGDVAEWDGRVVGLWPDAVAQGELAGANAVGAGLKGTPLSTPLLLKNAGLDLLVAGTLTPTSDGQVIRAAGPGTHDYVRLVLDPRGALIGALLLGRSADTAAVLEAVERGSVLTEHVAALMRGDLGVLATGAQGAQGGHGRAVVPVRGDRRPTAVWPRAAAVGTGAEAAREALADRCSHRCGVSHSCIASAACRIDRLHETGDGR